MLALRRQRLRSVQGGRRARPRYRARSRRGPFLAAFVRAARPGTGRCRRASCVLAGRCGGLGGAQCPESRSVRAGGRPVPRLVFPATRHIVNNGTPAGFVIIDERSDILASPKGCQTASKSVHCAYKYYIQKSEINIIELNRGCGNSIQKLHQNKSDNQFNSPDNKRIVSQKSWP